MLEETNNRSTLHTLMMEVIRTSETSVLTKAKWRNIPAADILYPEFWWLYEISKFK
jgi:hypothetical protein